MAQKNNKLIFYGIGIIALIIYLRHFANAKKLVNKNLQKVLFIGDSITSIYDSNSASISWIYPNVIRKKLKDAGRPLEVYTLAQGGKRTDWMIKTYLDDLAKGNGYDRAYIYGGVNDIFSNRKIEEVIGNIEKFIDISKEKGIQPYVIMGYKPLPFMDYKKMPTTIYVTKKEDYKPMIANYVKYHQALKDLAARRKDFTLVDEIDLKELTYDGIHPNIEGQKIIAETLYKDL